MITRRQGMASTSEELFDAIEADDAHRVRHLLSAVSRKRSPIVRRLLAEGANPNARQSAGWTPLHSAAHNGDLESVEELLAAGADPAATNDEGRSVQALAEERGHEPTIERLRSPVLEEPKDGD